MAPRESLHRRLALAVACGSLLFALVVGIAAFFVEYRSQYAKARELQDQLVATVISSAQVAAFAGNREIAGEVVNGLQANPIIAHVSLSSVNGFRHAGKQASNRPSPDITISYPLVSPMDHQDIIGHLSVEQNSHEINTRAIRAALRYAALLVLQTLVSAGLLMLLFGRIIGRPLARVARLLKEIQPGSSQRVPMPAGQENNEIGLLVNNTNALLGAVEHAITTERRLQAEVDEMQIHYQHIFQTTNVGIMILRPSGRLINCNPTLISRIVGVTFDAKSATDCQNFIDAIFQLPEQAWAMVWEARDSGQTVSGDLQLRSAAEGERWAHCMISVSGDEHGQIELIEGVLYDVTARRQRESEARRAAERDLLTGLANRRGMEHFLDQALRRATERGLECGVMLLDLDGFKAINDAHGHATGDAVLKEVARRMAQRVRHHTDQVARLGGDEFVLVAFDTGNTPQLLEQLAQDLINRIGAPIELAPDTSVSVGVSIGIACFPGDGPNRATLLAAADAAMYQIKQRGKNGFAMAKRGSPLPSSAPGN